MFYTSHFSIPCIASIKFTLQLLPLFFNFESQYLNYFKFKIKFKKVKLIKNRKKKTKFQLLYNKQVGNSTSLRHFESSQNSKSEGKKSLFNGKPHLLDSQHSAFHQSALEKKEDTVDILIFIKYLKPFFYCAIFQGKKLSDSFKKKSVKSCEIL